MTKSKRIILLTVDVITVLAGLVTIILAIGFATLRSRVSLTAPSRDEIYTAPVHTLQEWLRIAADNISVLSGTVEECGALLLFCGAVMFIGSVLRLLFTPWSLSKAAKAIVGEGPS